MKNSALAFLFLWIAVVYAGSTPIVRVLDSNLFELQNGRKIRLANVRAPSLHSKDKKMAALAKITARYARMVLVGQKTDIEFTEFRDDSGYVLVHVYQIFPLEKRNINALFLRKGFGWFVDNTDSLHKKEYQQAERRAREKHLGVWNPGSLFLPKGAPYQNALMIGFARTNKEETFQEFMIDVSPAELVNGVYVRVGVVRHVEEGRGWCEDAPFDWQGPAPHYKYVSYIYHAELGLNFYSKYVGLSVGLAGLLGNGGWCSEMPLAFFFPTFGLRAGLMNKMYLTADLFKDFNAPLTLGLQYIFNRPATNLWLGLMSPHEEKENIILAVANFGLNKRWILKGRGAFTTDGGIGAVSLGLGRILGR